MDQTRTQGPATTDERELRDALEEAQHALRLDRAELARLRDGEAQLVRSTDELQKMLVEGLERERVLKAEVEELKRRVGAVEPAPRRRFPMWTLWGLGLLAVASFPALVRTWESVVVAGLLSVLLGIGAVAAFLEKNLR